MYKKAVRQQYPNLEIVSGTHKPVDKKEFQAQFRELICPAIAPPKAMTDLIKAGR
jgi:hypothetical protein